jgi:hypothetical protein
MVPIKIEITKRAKLTKGRWGKREEGTQGETETSLPKPRIYRKKRRHPKSK